MTTRTGSAILPLHGGKTPRWLFERMVKLAQALIIAIVEDYGPEEVLRRLADPFWFQAFGCVLGFDWHSSGLTTTTGGAIKEALKPTAKDTGLLVAGGKGRVSRKTPDEIRTHAPDQAESLVEKSRLVAKVDSAAVQDGYQLYYHLFMFTPRGKWAVIQQGMNPNSLLARRYHWLSEDIKSFVSDPHSAVDGVHEDHILNLVASEAEDNRSASVKLINKPSREIAIRYRELVLPRRHIIVPSQDIRPENLEKALGTIHEAPPKDYQGLLLQKGVGSKTLRALALLAEIIHGAPPSFRDPARFSFAHGGKDGIPFPVDRKLYDRSIAVLEASIQRAHLSQTERDKLQKTLKNSTQPFLE